METSFYAALSRDRRGPIRILHEDHSAHGGDRSSQSAIEDRIRGLGLPSPSVGVHDEETGRQRTGAEWCREGVRFATHRVTISSWTRDSSSACDRCAASWSKMPSIILAVSRISRYGMGTRAP